MLELHADTSSAAAEIIAASVALNELLHLGYVTSELGLDYPQPIELEVDNATGITFSKDQVRRSSFDTSMHGKCGWRCYATRTL